MIWMKRLPNVSLNEELSHAKRTSLSAAGVSEYNAGERTYEVTLSRL